MKQNFWAMLAVFFVLGEYVHFAMGISTLFTKMFGH